MDAWESTPRLAFLSPEPGSGKTRALEVTEPLVPRPVEAVNVSPAYLFRKVGSEDGRPTILFDEIDTVFGPKAKDNEEIRGLLNAGHRKGAVAGRCIVVGKQVKTEEIPALRAVALAGLGNYPTPFFRELSSCECDDGRLTSRWSHGVAASTRRKARNSVTSSPYGPKRPGNSHRYLAGDARWRDGSRRGRVGGPTRCCRRGWRRLAPACPRCSCSARNAGEGEQSHLACAY